MTHVAKVKQSRFAITWPTQKLSSGLQTVHGIGGLVKVMWENALDKTTIATTRISQCASMYLISAMEIVNGLLESSAQNHQVNASATTMFVRAVPRTGAGFTLH